MRRRQQLVGEGQHEGKINNFKLIKIRGAARPTTAYRVVAQSHSLQRNEPQYQNTVGSAKHMLGPKFKHNETEKAVCSLSFFLGDPPEFIRVL